MPLLEQLLKNNPDNVKIVFKNFPLRMHKFAFPTAIAAMAAHRQGKFWEYHDLVFENYKKLNEEKLVELAKQVGLNMDQFAKDRKDRKLAHQIQSDMNEGMKAGVRGTPTMFINGSRLKVRDPQGIQKVIEKELQSLKGK